ncbi:GH92 family glycosyl hydrolase [Portibacter marinus]|uniref:GH92 family glycosyl hydrolase n=1 Tax=Portibacter marinus TaxID=2898660 RepID=UPI001F3253D1|nr:GH92 family glycosyl hydrolase [Portibacter marinus]
MTKKLQTILTSAILVFTILLDACYGQNLVATSPHSGTKSTEPVDLVYPLLDAANSRWFFFSSACRPFGMVNLSPDTQIGGAWGSGYRYDTDTIKGFSHIHGWQIAGISVLPVCYEYKSELWEQGYYSQFDHKKEEASVGYHKVELDRYDIEAELTSTKRVGFHRYQFRKDGQRAVIFQSNGRLGPADMKNGRLLKVNNKTIHGEITNAPTRRRPKDLKVHFAVHFDQEIHQLIELDADHQLVVFGDDIDELKMKVAISYTAIENAQENMERELPGWEFDPIVQESREEWNRLLSRVQVEVPADSITVRRFYTDLWHALQGRRTISDVNGSYPDHTGENFRIGRIPLNAEGNPEFNHYNSDSFWGAQWTLTTLWGLLYPDIYCEFVKSMLLYYKDGGLVPRGPSGGNYTYVMTGASSTPLIVSAFQKNLDIGEPSKIYEALKKNHVSGGIMSKAGYEHETNKGGGLEDYMTKGYVPYPNPYGDFGYHQAGAGLTLEYAFQDYTLAQMAKSLGKEEDYRYFMQRSKNYQNVYDPQSGWMRPKDQKGKWKEPFDPYEYTNGFVESNAAQATWFVPHDLDGLAELMGGKDKAVEKLNAQFEAAAERGFTAGDSHARGEDPTLARIPINYGNQPSMQTAYIFNHLDRPDLTQYWASRIVTTTFGGLSPHTGYNGDEDQGLMGSLAVLMKTGFFQMTGGVEADPIYTLSTPIFENISLVLPNFSKLIIEKHGKGEKVERIVFNGRNLNQPFLLHSQIMKGGHLEYYMK